MVGRELLTLMISFCRPPIFLPMMLSLMAIYLSGWAQLIGDSDACWLCFIVGLVSHCIFDFTPVHRRRSNWIKGRIKTKTRHYFAGHHRRTQHRIRCKLNTCPIHRRPSTWNFCTTFGSNHHQDTPSSSGTILRCLTASKKPRKRRQFRFDSDSYDIAIDNCASQCITNNESDFIGTPQKVNHTLHGVGQASITLKGTVSWAIEDDDGVVHHLTIKDCLFQPELPWRLLSPQHLSQVNKDMEGTGCITLGNRMELFWDKKRFRRTIPLNGSNVGIIGSAPDSESFTAFSATFPDPHETVKPRFSVTDNHQHHSSKAGNTPPTSQREESTDGDIREAPLPFNFEEHDTTISDHNDLDNMSAKQLEMLRFHERLNHLSPTKMKHMAKKGLLPAHFVTTEMPVCASCLFGKATKRPWRTKGQCVKVSEDLKPITAPGDCISVDQMESPHPGLVAQMKGKPTTRRHRAATVFIDHFSDFCYVHLQDSTSGDDTLAAKKAFEAIAQSYGVTIKHYHADNGRFADNQFIDHAASKGQSISYCGVGAHFQNGVAERRIRGLQEGARSSILLAKHRWPAAISVSLWPYAVRLSNDVANCTPRRSNTSQSPVEIFSKSKVRPRLKNFQHFGVPCYVLREPLQTSGGTVGKWNLWLLRRLMKWQIPTQNLMILKSSETPSLLLPSRTQTLCTVIKP